MRGQVAVRMVGVGLILVSLGGCRSPFDQEQPDASLRTAVQRAIEREMASAPAAGQSRETTQATSDVEAALADRRDELDRIGPLPVGDDLAADVDPETGADLTGAPQTTVGLTLDEAIETAIQHNLTLADARLQPAISDAELRAAEAIFDWTYFASADLDRTDEASTVPILGGIPLGSGLNASDRYRYETGVRRLLDAGGTVTISTDLTRSQDNSGGGFSLSPDPAFASHVRLGISQPLLRGFGSDVTRSTIAMGRNQKERSGLQLKTQMLQLVHDVEVAYWTLGLAWRDLAIKHWLVREGEEVRDYLQDRLEFDTRLAEYADAVATVEQRKADVIRAQRQVRAASDTLKRLLHHPDAAIGAEAMLRPTDDIADHPISFDVHEALATAVSTRPEARQAILDIDDTRIRQLVARNAQRPQLNLDAQIAWFGLNDNAESSYEELFESNFVDYVLGLTYEIPIGNNAARAEHQAARLRRSSATLRYQRTIEDIMTEVKAALRDVVTNYELIQASRSFRIAQAENLRVLSAQEELRGLTPEFLNLKFTRQDGLARARSQEIGAQVDYIQAIARLYRAMGTGLQMSQIEFIVEEDAGPDHF